MRIKTLLKATEICGYSPDFTDFEVKGLSCNSKNIKKDFIFFAVPGAREDGCKFIPEAIDNGARAVIISATHYKGINKILCAKHLDRIFFILVRDMRKAVSQIAAEYYGHPSRKIKVAGITGTNGKTTITYLLESILRKNGSIPAVIGTVNYRFKDKVVASKNTTPGPIELESLLADMADARVQYVAMEVSSHALDQKRTEGITFHSAIFTNLTQDHLDYHKTLEKYFQAKSALFRNLEPSSYAVINNDDSYAARLKRACGGRVITYGIDRPADIRATSIEFGLRQTECLVTTKKIKLSIKTGLVGKHNLYNVLAVIAWAISEGIDPEVVRRGLEEFSFVPGRLERIKCKGDFSVFVDYAHTPDALKNILHTLRPLSKNRVIAVFGCGGERDRTKRPKMGRCVSELADYAIITNDNPRSEDPLKIIRDIKKGIRKNNYAVIPDRFNAIKKVLGLAKSGDTVLIAGKGHENYQILNDKIIHFDDRKVAKECLKSLNY